MKIKIRNEYLNYLSYENLWECYKQTRKGKTSQSDVMNFSFQAQVNVYQLYQDLKNLTYTHGGYNEFYVYSPKKRKIETPSFRDRIVHTWICKYFLEEYFGRAFISTSYACIEGRGAHKAVLDLQKGMKKYKRKYGGYYILKMDVRKYFQNIDKQVLIEILKRKIADKYLEDLLYKVIYSQDCEKGLPAGNYTSQMFANIYLNEVDQYIKTELKVKKYYRYMDDMIILAPTKEQAVEYLNAVKEFLANKLKLSLNGKTQIFPNKNGVAFCGYVIRENKIRLNAGGKKRLKNKVKKLKKFVKYGLMNSEEAVQVLTGHRGYIGIADADGLKNTIFSDFEFVLEEKSKYPLKNMENI